MTTSHGQGLVEYVLLIALVAVVVAASLQAAGPALRDTFRSAVEPMSGGDAPPMETPAGTPTPAPGMTPTPTPEFVEDECVLAMTLGKPGSRAFSCRFSVAFSEFTEGTMFISPALPDDHSLVVRLPDNAYTFYGRVPAGKKKPERPAFSGPVSLSVDDLAGTDMGVSLRVNYFGMGTAHMLPWSGTLTIRARGRAGE